MGQLSPLRGEGVGLREMALAQRSQDTTSPVGGKRLRIDHLPPDCLGSRGRRIVRTAPAARIRLITTSPKRPLTLAGIPSILSQPMIRSLLRRQTPRRYGPITP